MFTVPLIIGCAAAFLIGLSKTGLPGVGIGGVVLMIYAFPGEEKQSTGAVVPLLLLADLFAVYYHSRDVQWSRLRTLFPPVLIGLILGALVLEHLNNEQFRILLGGLILSLFLFEWIRSRNHWNAVPDTKYFTWLMGGSAGFTTLVGNAAGPVMSVYMSSQNLTKERFMGTWVWFFFCVNLAKIPFMTGLIFPELHMITEKTLKFDFMLVPAIFLGAIVGKRLYSVIPEKYFIPIVFLLNIIPPLEMLIAPFLFSQSK